MASTEENQLRALEQIAKHTGDTARAIAGGRNKGNFSGDGDDALGKSTKGLFASFSDLKKQSDALAATNKNLDEITKKRTKEENEVSSSLKKLQKSLENAKTKNDDVDQAYESMETQINALNAKMGEVGFNADSLKNIFYESETTIEGVIKKLKGFEEVVDSNINSARKAQKEAEKDAKKSRKNVEAQTKSVFKKILAGASVFVVQMSGIVAQTQKTGFETGGVSGLANLGLQSGLMGISPNEALTFAAQNRDVITSLTKTATLSADESMEAVKGYGVIIRKTFGVTGQQKMELVSKGMTALSSLGTEISPETFTAFNQGVENMAKTANMTADEIFSEFSELAELEGMQSLMLSLGEGANVGTMLSESFLALQSATHLNANEFTKYRRKLAEENKRTGVDRVVQAAFIGQLANAVGNFSDADISLLERGKAYRESLSEGERIRFDVLQTNLGKELATARIEAQKAGDTQRLTELEIYGSQAGVEAQTAIVARDQAGIGGAVAAVQDERVEASEKATDTMVALNAQIRDLALGFSKSPLGQAAVFGSLIEGSTFAGVFSGTMAANAVSVATGAAKGGMMGGAMKLLGTGAAVVGLGITAFAGIKAAMESEGDLLEKTLVGFSEGVDASTGGMATFVGGLIRGEKVVDGMTLGEKIYDLTHNDPLANIDTSGLEGIKAMGEQWSASTGAVDVGLKKSQEEAITKMTESAKETTDSAIAATETSGTGIVEAIEKGVEATKEQTEVVKELNKPSNITPVLTASPPSNKNIITNSTGR